MGHVASHGAGSNLTESQRTARDRNDASQKMTILRAIVMADM
jgi:hypothetical protein